MSDKEKPVCAECRSESLGVTATVYWNLESQSWDTDYIESAYCNECDGEVDLFWVPEDWTPADDVDADAEAELESLAMEALEVNV